MAPGVGPAVGAGVVAGFFGWDGAVAWERGLSGGTRGKSLASISRGTGRGVKLGGGTSGGTSCADFAATTEPDVTSVLAVEVLPETNHRRLTIARPKATAPPTAMTARLETWAGGPPDDATGRPVVGKRELGGPAPDRKSVV